MDTTDPQSYPHPSGDVTVLGPEIFASTPHPQDDTVIGWRGQNFVPQDRTEDAFPPDVNATTFTNLLASKRQVGDHRYPVLEHFRYDHLPEPLQAVSVRFAALAWILVDWAEETDPEIATALRKLLEAKDCAVRAAVR